MRDRVKYFELKDEKNKIVRQIHEEEEKLEREIKERVRIEEEDRHRIRKEITKKSADEEYPAFLTY